MMALGVTASIRFYSIGFAQSEICGSPDVFVCSKFDKECSLDDAKKFAVVNSEEVKKKITRQSRPDSIGRARLGDSFRRGTSCSSSGCSPFGQGNVNIVGMEGTEMINGTMLRQESRKLWQYLASISGISMEMFCTL